LLECGADPKAILAQGVTPLYKAARNGHAATLDLLLKSGAVVNARAEDGSTALVKAAQKGHADALQVCVGVVPSFFKKVLPTLHISYLFLWKFRVELNVTLILRVLTQLSFRSRLVTTTTILNLFFFLFILSTLILLLTSAPRCCSHTAPKSTRATSKGSPPWWLPPNKATLMS